MLFCKHFCDNLLEQNIDLGLLGLKRILVKKRKQVISHILSTGNFELDMRIPTISIIRQIVDVTTADSHPNAFQNFLIVLAKFDFKLRTNLESATKGSVFSDTYGKRTFPIYESNYIPRVELIPLNSLLPKRLTQFGTTSSADFLHKHIIAITRYNFSMLSTHRELTQDLPR